jgi:hypothetical protein
MKIKQKLIWLGKIVKQKLVFKNIVLVLLLLALLLNIFFISAQIFEYFRKESEVVPIKLSEEETLKLVKEKSEILEFFLENNLNISLEMSIKVLEKIEEIFTQRDDIKKTVFETKKERFKNLENELKGKKEKGKDRERSAKETEDLISEMDRIIEEKHCEIKNQLERLKELFEVKEKIGEEKEEDTSGTKTEKE